MQFLISRSLHNNHGQVLVHGIEKQDSSCRTVFATKYPPIWKRMLETNSVISGAFN